MKDVVFVLHNVPAKPSKYDLRVQSFLNYINCHVSSLLVGVLSVDDLQYRII